MQRTKEICLRRCQRGWYCEIVYTLTTTRQFTDEYCDSRAGGRWWFVALFRAWRYKRAFSKEQGAKSGERKAMGWAD